MAGRGMGKRTGEVGGMRRLSTEKLSPSEFPTSSGIRSSTCFSLAEERDSWTNGNVFSVYRDAKGELPASSVLGLPLIKRSNLLSRFRFSPAIARLGFTKMKDRNVGFRNYVANTM